MTNRFREKVVLVVGGNSGIGLACARAFHREGARLVLTGRDPTTLADVAAELGEGVLTLRLAVENLELHALALEQIRARFGHIDVLLANAGTGGRSTFGDTRESQWDRIVDGNLKGLYFLVQTLLPLLSRGSNVLFTSSVAVTRPRPGYSVYAASKAGVSSFARSLGCELVNEGIRVNVVSPGPIETAMFTRMPMHPEDRSRFHDAVAAGNPMRRWGRADEVANAVLFLASDEASFITGVDLAVDGGASSF